jgi:hypothetical protein
MRMMTVSVALLLLCCLSVQASVLAGPSYVAKNQYITGYFGGLKPGNIFKLLLSLHGGAKFYRINPDAAANFAKLPLNAPIRILVDLGLVTSVEIMEGQR